ncbi:hypothetical protein TSOC_002903 [Tetrabaena socialis]|uniref:Glycosyltransferase family 92 protein n=1 Tax=Tetrabaena socialis TaxID=47790 RepID=A0A2J8ACW5_9CHLO|nr:hypothetical protein TSOC_002903 [Tetrabaena socialis]|eukprot:PNH10365.1 hypothetical protein TSOC_002903 [Tetrabaena socialis]
MFVRFVGGWLKYHFWAGVDFVYLLDHDSLVPLWPEVRDYALEGKVQYTRFSSEKVTNHGFKGGLQGRVFTNCMEQAKGYFTWLMLTDHDEYMYVNDPAYNHSIPAVLRPLENRAGAVLTHWRHVGSGGLVERPEGAGMMNTFHKCRAKLDEHVKGIIRLDHATLGNTSHCFTYSGGRSGRISEYTERATRLKAGVSGIAAKNPNRYKDLDRVATADCMLGKQMYALMQHTQVSR